MGANLGNGGKVKWNSCIECPFHGWTFDGRTGKCVTTSNLESKIVSHHIYNDVNNMVKQDGTFIRKEQENCESKLETYEV